MRYLLLSIVLVAAVAYGEGQLVAGSDGTSRWRLAWQDEFDGPELNTDVWVRCKRGTPNWKDTMTEDPALLQINDGVLRLIGVENRDRESDPAPYHTAGITTRGKYTFKYGKVEIRARFKSAQGAWPALWMLGAEKGWPHCGEIDLMEHLNFDEIVYQTVHSDYTLNIDKSKRPRPGTTAPIDRDGWNTYGCEWDSDKIVFTVNGKASHTYPRVEEKGVAQWPFDQSFYFIFSMQIGGAWVNGSGPTKPEHYPAWMEIDYVRVYERVGR